MSNQTLAADGGFFRLVNGQRVWISNPPNSFIHDALHGRKFSTRRAGDPARVQDVIRLLNERNDAVPTEHSNE